MGCGSSSEAYSPGDNGGWDDDLDFDESVKRRDKRNLKVCSGAPDGGKDDDDRGEDYTEYSEPRFGYSGQIMEPDNHNDVNLEKPTATFELEHVYGYRCMDTRQNVWFNKNGKIVYFTAALGVIMDPSDNSQMYFGGGEVDCTAKNVARDNNHHTDDIMSIALNEARDTAVSGQVGSSPAIFCWDACTGEKKCRIKIAKGARGIAAVAFSQDGEYIAAVDLHNEHRVYCFTSNGQQLMKQNGDTNKIKDVAFSKTPGDTRFATAGKKHIYFWDAKDASFKKKGIFDGNPMTSFSAVMWDADGNCYTGGANGGIYKWAAETRMCTGFSQSHKKGCFVSALNIFEGKIYSGAKDNQIAITNCESMECTQTIQVNSMPRALDQFNGSMVCGFRDGSITVDERPVMCSHSDGEVWGLAYIDGQGPVTSADDNKVIFYEQHKKQAIKSVKITDRQENCKRGGASTLANNYDSQQSRAVAICDDWLAIATNDGAVTIRRCSSPEQDGSEILIQDSSEWIEAMAFSPDKKMLAVGSHDNCIRIYDCENNFSQIGNCQAHNSFITSLDWSRDSTYIRSNCGAYELLFFNIPDCTQDKDGASNTKSVEWATNTVKIGWHVRGIWPSGVDGSHVNGVNSSPDGTLLATGDDYGLVCLWNNPCRPGAQPRCYRGHSEHVVRVMFCPQGQKLFSIGGYDQTLMQYNKTSA